jgi:hypothetical protein
MKLENMEKANELAESIKMVDRKIAGLNGLDFSGLSDLRISDRSNISVHLFPAEIGPGKAAEIQNELWDALLKTKADLTAELEKL